MNLLQRLEHRVAQMLGAFDAEVTALGRLGGVEGVAGQSDHASAANVRRPVHFRLGALGLEFVQDAGQFGDLADSPS